MLNSGSNSPDNHLGAQFAEPQTPVVEKAPKQFTYERRKPEETTLYKLVQENWRTFEAQVVRDTGYALPDFVVKEFEEYLRCGILAHGFLRAQCEKCHHEMLVAFSCKRRGFCPSCGARRMSETAAHLVDSVLPLKNIRQWVLTFPMPIRLCFAVKPKLMARALDIAITTISSHYRKLAGLKKSNSKTGAVTLIQRFGGSLNVNIHFHILFIDGIYELGDQKAPTDFLTSNPPTIEELDKVMGQIINRVTRYLERQGIIIKDEDSDKFQLPISEDDAFTRLQASSVTYRFATGPRKGQKAFVLKSMSDEDHNSKSGLVVKNSGFSLHAGVSAKATEREKLERIARYIARPAVAEERLSTNVAGDVIYRFKKPWDDGTTALKMTPLEFMERLAALVPRPRVHLTRFHGVLAPHYKYRRDVVPKPVSQLTLEETGPESSEDDSSGKQRMHWARLLKRVFNIDVESCPLCQGRVRIIAAIEEPPVIKKILQHLGLPTSPPRIHGPRGPPATLFDEYAQSAHSSDSDVTQLFPD